MAKSSVQAKAMHLKKAQIMALRHANVLLLALLSMTKQQHLLLSFRS